MDSGPTERSLGRPALEALFGLILSVVATLVYIDSRRKNLGGFRRLAAFWFGFPVTFFCLLLVSEGSQPKIRDDDTGLRELEEAIRRDRRAREPGTGPPPDHSNLD